jgi:hypothetical protein
MQDRGRGGEGREKNKVMFMGNFGCDAIEEVVLTCDVRVSVEVRFE